jgi:hypothetical protein
MISLNYFFQEAEVKIINLYGFVLRSENKLIDLFLSCNY